MKVKLPRKTARKYMQRLEGKIYLKIHDNIRGRWSIFNKHEPKNMLNMCGSRSSSRTNMNKFATSRKTH